MPRGVTRDKSLLTEAELKQQAVRAAYYQANKVRHNEYNKALYRELRRQIIEAYGGECVCCHEKTPEFLGIDHIFSDGAHDRNVLKLSAHRIYQKLRREGFPKDRFQLLCHNCNQAKGYYGTCPHQKRETK